VKPDLRETNRSRYALQKEAAGAENPAASANCEHSEISAKTRAYFFIIWYNPRDCCEQVFVRALQRAQLGI